MLERPDFDRGRGPEPAPEEQHPVPSRGLDERGVHSFGRGRAGDLDAVPPPVARRARPEIVEPGVAGCPGASEDEHSVPRGIVGDDGMGARLGSARGVPAPPPPPRTAPGPDGAACPRRARRGLPSRAGVASGPNGATAPVRVSTAVPRARSWWGPQGGGGERTR